MLNTSNQFAVQTDRPWYLVVRHVPGDGAAGARPEKLAAVFGESRAAAAGGQTNTDSGKEVQRVRVRNDVSLKYVD